MMERNGARAGAAFCARAVPPAPKQAGAFQRFRYSLDPYEAQEDTKRQERQERQKTLAGAFSAGGNARDGKRLLKQRMPELRNQLLRTLRADWPSFRRVSIDERGCLLAVFAAEKLSAERRSDLHAYMNRLLNTHAAAAEFGLNRDPSRWGAVPAPSSSGSPDGGASSAPSPLVYAFRPPWVPNDLLRAQALLEQPLSTAPTAGDPAS